MNSIKKWSEIAALKNSEFLVINVTHRDKKTNRLSGRLYDENIKLLEENRTGYWALGSGKRFEYVVLFFHELDGVVNIYLGRKIGASQRVGQRFVIDVDRWINLGVSHEPIRSFCEGLPVSAHPVIVWRQIPGKCVRICWNSLGWQRASGDAVHLEKGSYVSEYGFGHEEWLFDWSMLVKPAGEGEFYKYGFLQPVGKYRTRYVGMTMDVLLYTVDPTGEKVIVARIKKLYVPNDDEVKRVVSIYRRNRWLRDMQKRIASLGWKESVKSAFERDTSVVNVRFRQEDVEFFDPRILLPSYYSGAKSNRYHPFDWDRIVPEHTLMPVDEEGDGSDELPEENVRKRAAVEGVEINPRHLKIQNAMYRYLQRRYRPSVVQRESERVDIRLKLGNEIIFFEIKTAPTAKQCIREALGQLLEYGHYANKNRAQKLIVVSDVKPNGLDLVYLNNIRVRYAIPINYAQWRWDLMELDYAIAI